MAFLVLDLETHIQIKEGLGQKKDMATIPILRRTFIMMILNFFDIFADRRVGETEIYSV